jgi:excisionase family DNA binding protein
MRYENEEKEMIQTLANAGKILKICRYAVWNAVKKNRIKGVKVGGQWAFTRKEVEDYKKSRYDRKYSKIGDELLYDKTKGEHSISEAAKLLGCPAQHVYFACRSNKIKASKKRFSWVINEKDINEYLKVMHLGRKKKK